MLGRGVRLCGAIATAVGVLAIGPADVSATTFCVPAYTSVCPNSEGNVQEADLEKAMSLQATDGIADRVVIAPGTVTEDGAFEPPGGSADTLENWGDDPLVVEGAGRSATFLTTAASANVYVVNFAASNPRPTTMRNLTVRIPAGFPDGLGAGFQIQETILEDVDLVSLNAGSQGLTSAVGPGNVFRDGEIRGEGGGSILVALSPGFGSLLAENSTIISPETGLNVTGANSNLTARRLKILNAETGAAATVGSITIENSLITIEGGYGLDVIATQKNASIGADHLTLVGIGEPLRGIRLGKSKEAGISSVAVSNSIVRGFQASYNLVKAIGPGIGAASLAVRYSNLPLNGENTNGTVDVATGNIDADPLFAGDYSLPPSSPSVDAGDPAAGGLTTDILGALRPTDGDGDGVARQDQGAFEYQPPAPPPPPAKPLPAVSDTRPPVAKITKGPGKKLAEGVAKFSFSADEARSTFRCKLDRKKPAKCKTPKTYKHLKPGRHTFKVWAIDAAGNESKAAKRSFAVPE